MPARRGTEPGGGQDPADRPFPYPVPQAQQLTLDPPVTPAGVLPRQLFDESTHFGRDGRPSRRARVDPFLPDQAPVPAQQSAGVTIRCSPRCPGSNLARAASTARSAQSGLGPATCRRSTATSCRSTKISASFAASSRARSTSQPSTRTMNK